MTLTFSQIGSSEISSSTVTHLLLPQLHGFTLHYQYLLTKIFKSEIHPKTSKPCYWNFHFRFDSKNTITQETKQEPNDLHEKQTVNEILGRNQASLTTKS